MGFIEYTVSLSEFAHWIPFPCLVHDLSGLVLSKNDLAVEFMKLEKNDNNNINIYDHFIEEQYRISVNEYAGGSSHLIPEFTTLLRRADQSECMVHEYATIHTIDKEIVVCNMFTGNKNILPIPVNQNASPSVFDNSDTKIIDILNMYTFSMKHTIMHMKQTINTRLNELSDKVKQSDNGNLPVQELRNDIESIKQKVESFKVINQPVLHKLSQNEIHIARLIKAGKSSKEIAHNMHLSLDSINKYRISIRKKFGLSGKSENLSQYLRNLILE